MPNRIRKLTICITRNFGSTPKCVKVSFKPSRGPGAAALWAAGSVTASRRVSMAGKGLAARGGGGGAPPVQTGGLLREEEREDAETFGERHTDDGLNEDLAGSAGIAADG